MGFHQAQVVITRMAAADLSASQYRFVKSDSDGNVVLAGAGEMAIGVVTNKPANGEAASIVVFGAVPLKFTGTVQAGTAIASGASGVAVAATGARVNTSDGGAAQDALIGPYAMGILLEDAANGDEATVFVNPMGAIPTTVAA